MPDRIITTAAQLNWMIQDYIDSRLDDDDNWHTGVYFQPVDPSGCNWNIGVNSNGEAVTCGASLSVYLDWMRSRYAILPDDATAIPAYLSRRALSIDLAASAPDPARADPWVNAQTGPDADR